MEMLKKAGLEVKAESEEFPKYLLEWDLEKTIKCEDLEDCPDDSSCYTHTEYGNFCMCVSGLVPAREDEPCKTNTTTSVEHHSGVIADLSNLNGKAPESSPTNISRNATQTRTELPDRDSIGADESLSVAFKVLIPLAGTLVLSVIVIIVLLRHFRTCRHKSKRGKNTSAVKASEDILLLDRMNNVNKNPVYFETKTSGVTRRPHVTDIPMDKIKLMEAVGEGAFGQVFKGLFSTSNGGGGVGSVAGGGTGADDSVGGGDGEIQIAVKVLKEGVSNEARDDFEREVEIMSAFDHDNILKLLGIVSNNGSDTPYMIFEYMLYGDLAELLRKNDPSMRSEDVKFRLQRNNLIDITTQIANGMKYLTSQHFVHRDLATRNCLVGEGLVVKISDFGMSRDIYTCDYYKIGGSRMLPVRWMSPEAVKWGRFTTESDIWAFGVVLWEIFSYGRQPYYGHTNEEVIRFLDEGILLQRPEECPSVAYHVMLQCWKLDHKERLPFDRIYKYLTEYGKQLANTAQNTSLEHVNEYEIPL